jgi:hypothetical protein
VLNRLRFLAVPLGIAALVPALAFANPGVASTPGYAPAVPVSALGTPFLDASRLRFSTNVSFGTGFGGQSEGLQVTSIGYAMSQKTWFNVNVGSSFSSNGRGSSMFLEGLDFMYRPNNSMHIQIQYRDIRSPLQYQMGGFQPWGN